MEKDFGSWSHHQHSDWQSPNLNSLCAPLGPQNSVPSYMKTCTNNVYKNGTFPISPLSGLPISRESQLNEHHGWFYCPPRFCQTFTPVENSIKEKIPTENHGDAVTPKRFLVFDQSGDQTNLIYSSGLGTRVQFPNSWTPKPLGAYVLDQVNPGNERVTYNHSGTNLTTEYDENHDNDLGSEMREDTEEINALLYSDDDDNDYSEDEVTSTGHSPSTMTAHDKQGWYEESGDEEVASSAEPTKRQKLFDGGYDVPSLTDAATSVKLKTNRCFKCEDDAESSCGDIKNHGLREFDSLLGDKRLRKEKIQETVSILRSIIPCEKGSDAIVVLNEAIHYFSSLKRKAEALGLDTL